MLLRDLMEQRGRIVAEMRGITEKPAGEGGDLSTDQSQRFDTLKGDLSNLEKRIERQTFLDEAERRASGVPVTGTGDHQLDAELRNFSVVKAIAAASGLNVEAGREKELSAELERRSGRKAEGIMVPYQVMERRVLTTSLPSGGPGSNIVATDYRGDLYIDRLRAQMVVRRLGARVMTGLVGNLAIPALKASATAGWVGENGALTPADPEFRQVTMTPKHAGGIVEMSRNMLMQSSPDVEALVRDDLAKLLAEAVDRVAIVGGDTNEPDGILLVAATKNHNMATPSWSNLLALIGLVEDADAEGTAFLAHPSVFRKLQQTVKDSSAPELGFIMNERGTLAGYTTASTTLSPTYASPKSAALIFGNFSEMVLGFWSELDLLVNPFESTAYSKGNVQVRAMMTCDLAVRHAESFAASPNVGL